MKIRRKSQKYSTVNEIHSYLGCLRHLDKMNILMQLGCLFKNYFYFLIFIIFYCILRFGVHVKNMQDSCIGTHVAVWFAVFLPFTYIWHFSPCYLCPTPHPPLSLPYFPRRTPVCDALLPVSMCSHCSTPTYEREHAVFDFLFLCQFAENDGF